MNNPLGLPALISPYVGGKGGARYFRKFGLQAQSLICDRSYHYDVIVEPFAGSGAATWQHNHGINAVIAADVDPGVQAVWECWGEYKNAVPRACDDWRKEITTVSAKRAFDKLKRIYEKRGHHRHLVLTSRLQYEYAAAYLTLKRLVFGGVLRCNKEGKLNVALSKDKLEKYLNGWQYEWPDNGIESLTFRHSWQGAVEALADSDYKNALVVVDPPYYSPQQWTEIRKDGRKVESRMTPAYPGHDPQSANELALCVDCLDAVLATGKAGRIVVFNYWSDELHAAIVERVEANGGGSMLAQSNLGHLGNMNNSQQFHGRDTEAVWEIGGRRMFRDVDSVKQTTLLELS